MLWGCTHYLLGQPHSFYLYYISLRSNKRFAKRWIKEKLPSKSAIIRLSYLVLSEKVCKKTDFLRVIIIRSLLISPYF